MNDSGMTVREVAERFRVSKNTLYRHYDRETSTIDVGWTKLRVITIGRRISIPRAEVERALCERDVA